MKIYTERASAAAVIAAMTTSTVSDKESETPPLLISHDIQATNSVQSALEADELKKYEADEPRASEWLRFVRCRISAQASAAPAQTSVPPTLSATVQVPVSSTTVSPSLNIQQPTTFEDDMRDLRAAAAASLAESLEAARKHELFQMELNFVMQASDTSSALHMDFEPSTASGSGATASGSGVGSQECTQEEIQVLQTHDGTLTLDSRGKAITKPVAQCDKELHQQRDALIGTGLAKAPSQVALVVQPAALPVASLESISAHTNMLAAAATYEAVPASDAKQLQALSESQVPAHKHERIQMELDSITHASGNSLSLHHVLHLDLLQILALVPLLLERHWAVKKALRR
jgi:hypothetical protein